jgi:tRNA(Phe) wybutosine-synthesizing methylase Tyw3
VADAGVQIVPDEYVRYLVRLGNEKFDDNERRIAKLEQEMRAMFGAQAEVTKMEPLPCSGL